MPPGGAHCALFFSDLDRGRRHAPSDFRAVDRSNPTPGPVHWRQPIAILGCRHRHWAAMRPTISVADRVIASPAAALHKMELAKGGIPNDKFRQRDHYPKLEAYLKGFRDEDVRFRFRLPPGGGGGQRTPHPWPLQIRCQRRVAKCVRTDRERPPVIAVRFLSWPLAAARIPAGRPVSGPTDSSHGGRLYRPELDGLRTIAVVSVILFHAKFQIRGVDLVAGGFIGVDIFFVISGYLIGGILFRETQTNSFSLVKFYERRARRILPALYVVLFSTIPLAWLLLLPVEMKGYGAALVSATASISNIFFWWEIGYDVPDNAANPLIHTWSLGLEEQFYLLFPALLMLVTRYARPLLAMLLIAACAGSLVLAIIMTARAPEASFFLLPARIWELGAGALLALREFSPKPIDSPAAKLAPAIGLAAVMVSIVIMPLHLHHPGLLTMIPVLGTVLIIRYSDAREPVGRWLASRPMVAVGLISYSLYLWHQPVLAFGRLMRVDEPTLAVKLGWVAVASILATATYWLVEKPTRDRRQVSARAIWVIAGSGALVLVTTGAWLFENNGAPQRFAGPLAAVARAEIVEEATIFQSGKGCMNFAPSAGPCHFAVPGKLGHELLLVGDSHARLLSGPLIDRLRTPAPLSSVTLLTRGGCLFLPGLARVDGLTPSCPDGYNAARMRYILNRPDAIVVMMMRLPVVIEMSRFDNGAAGVEAGLAPHISLAAGPFDRAVSQQQIEARFSETVKRVLAAGVKVVLVYPVPEMGWNIPLKLMQLARDRPEGTWLSPVEASVSRQQFLTRSQRTYTMLDGVGEHPDLVRVYPERLFCRRERCRSHDGTDIFYRDDNHLSRSGADRLADDVVAAISQHWGRQTRNGMGQAIGSKTGVAGAGL